MQSNVVVCKDLDKILTISSYEIRSVFLLMNYDILSKLWGIELHLIYSYSRIRALKISYDGSGNQQLKTEVTSIKAFILDLT